MKIIIVRVMIIVKKQGVDSPRKRKPPVHLFLHHDSLSAQGLNGTGHEKGSDGKKACFTSPSFYVASRSRSKERHKSSCPTFKLFLRIGQISKVGLLFEKPPNRSNLLLELTHRSSEGKISKSKTRGWRSEALGVVSHMNANPLHVVPTRWFWKSSDMLHQRSVSWFFVSSR